MMANAKSKQKSRSLALEYLALRLSRWRLNAAGRLVLFTPLLGGVPLTLKANLPLLLKYFAHKKIFLYLYCLRHTSILWKAIYIS